MLRTRVPLWALLVACATAPACGGVSRLEHHGDGGATRADDDDEVPPALDAGAPDDAATDGGSPSDFVSLAAGMGHTCALRRDGGVACWGSNGAGQLGDGTSVTRPVPSNVQELGTAVSIGAYDQFSCAVISDGTVRCWGLTIDLRLGSASLDPDPYWLAQPVTVPGVSGAFGLSRGSTARHACALTSPWLYCWGNDESLQLAQSSSASSAGPGVAAGSSDTTMAGGAYRHSCIVNVRGYVGCVGAPPGNGQAGPTSILTTLPGVEDARAVATGSDFGCALLAGGTVVCWGRNESGELGDGTTADRVEVAAVPGLAGVTRLALGAFHACALHDSGKVSCWGNNLEGELGDGSNASSSRPVQVQELAGIVDIAAGNQHSCALGASGAAWCWGANTLGQLGNGGDQARASPDAVVRAP